MVFHDMTLQNAEQLIYSTVRETRKGGDVVNDSKINRSWLRNNLTDFRIT